MIMAVCSCHDSSGDNDVDNKNPDIYKIAYIETDDTASISNICIINKEFRVGKIKITYHS